MGGVDGCASHACSEPHENCLAGFEVDLGEDAVGDARTIDVEQVLESVRVCVLIGLQDQRLR